MPVSIDPKQNSISSFKTIYRFDSKLLFFKTGLKAVISYGKLTFLFGNERVSTFAGVFDPGEGQIIPAYIEIPPAVFQEAPNAVRPFFRI